MTATNANTNRCVDRENITPEVNMLDPGLEEFFKAASQLSEASAEAGMRNRNEAYRAGKPIVPNEIYDRLMEVFAEKFPSNAFFNQKEVESDLGAIEGKVLKLPERMLSTQKVYSIAEIEKWSDNVVKVGRNLGVTDFQFKITPKLDGFAAYDDGKILYTRGDGRNGTDITRALDRGMLVSGKKRGPGSRGNCC